MPYQLRFIRIFFNSLYILLFQFIPDTLKRNYSNGTLPCLSPSVRFYTSDIYPQCILLYNPKIKSPEMQMIPQLQIRLLPARSFFSFSHSFPAFFCLWLKYGQNRKFYTKYLFLLTTPLLCTILILITVIVIIFIF